MKNQMNVLWCLLILFAFTACESDSVEQQVNATTTNYAQEAFFEGETNDQNRGKKGKLCGVLGPICATPNQTVTYFYASPANNPTITWTVNSGSITLTNGQGTNTASFSFGSNFSGGQITVTGIGVPNCTVILEIPLCGPPECDYVVGVLDEYIDGTQSGANFVYLYAGGNFPAGTIYSWVINRQDGSTQNYAATTDNPRLVSASIANRIVSAAVTATFENCVETSTNNFWCAIPNSDINGDLFPECL